VHQLFDEEYIIVPSKMNRQWVKIKKSL
jgi:hypothetical protein